MDRLLVDQEFLDTYGTRLSDIFTRHALSLEPLTLPRDAQARLDEAAIDDIVLAAFSGTWEADEGFTRRFFGTLLRAGRLRWMHVPNAGVDHPVFAQLQSRGVRLTTSSGSSAQPIAQSAIAGMLALARGLPHWMRSQQRHRWEPLRGARRDLAGQTMVVVGLGAIGNEVARLARAIGLRVIGVRRSPPRGTDHVDELVPPSALNSLLPRADWLVLTCPLTDETRRMIDAPRLSLLPHTCVLINVGRGQVVDQAALIEALQRQSIAGAYLDVFEEEPLPVRSPLWDFANVIVSPHDSAGSSGNRARVSELFLENLEHWAKGEPLRNEV